MNVISSWKPSMDHLVNIVIFSTFFLIPFLGGNHLALFYVTVDRFWIESIFGIILILSISAQFLKGRLLTDHFLRFSCFFLPFLSVTTISLLYSWNKFNTLISINFLILAAATVYLYSLSQNKNICIIGLIAGASVSSICAILQHLILFPQLINTFQQGLNAQILMEQSGIPFSSYSYHNILGSA